MAIVTSALVVVADPSTRSDLADRLIMADLDATIMKRSNDRTILVTCGGISEVQRVIEEWERDDDECNAKPTGDGIHG